MNNKSYQTFLMMLAASFVVMYCVMFLNVSELDHIYISTTRFYMTFLMVSPMALLMLLMMPKMYPSKKLNTVIKVSSIFIFCGSLFALRTQTPIGDVQYMKAMIPHHSSAILTSSHANIQDPDVRKLADDIIKAQKKEIAEMKAMIKRLEK